MVVGIKGGNSGTSLAVLWLRPHALYARDVGSIPDQGTKIPHASQSKKIFKNKLKEVTLGKLKYSV